MAHLFGACSRAVLITDVVGLTVAYVIVLPLSQRGSQKCKLMCQVVHFEAACKLSTCHIL